MGNRSHSDRYDRTGGFSVLRQGGDVSPGPHDPDILEIGSRSRPEIRAGIRPGRKSDACFIRRLTMEVFTIYGPYEEAVPKWFELDTTVTLISTLNEEPVGFAMIGRLSNKWDLRRVTELLAIAVDPKSRGTGIGDMLVKEIEKRAAKLRIKRIFLHTAVNNRPARGLFTKHGYRPCEIKRNFYPAGQDAVVMSKEIIRETPK